MFRHRVNDSTNLAHHQNRLDEFDVGKLRIPMEMARGDDDRYGHVTNAATCAKSRIIIRVLVFLYSTLV